MHTLKHPTLFYGTYGKEKFQLKGIVNGNFLKNYILFVWFLTEVLQKARQFGPSDQISSSNIFPI